MKAIQKSILLLLLFVTSGAVSALAADSKYGAYYESDSTLVLYYDGDYSVRKKAGIPVYSISYGQPGYCDACGSKTVKVIIDESFSNVFPETMESWFYGMTAVREFVGLENINTGNVTNMQALFHNCSSLRSLDLSSFDTKNVQNMQLLFAGCSSLKSLDLSSFKTGNVTNMVSMFSGCTSLESVNLSSFNTSNVTSMYCMFSNCSSLKSINLSRFNTSNVTNMSQMFQNNSSLTELNLSKFNTSNVTDMSSMFYGNTSLTELDLSKFDTSKVKYMTSMFAECSNLITVYVSDKWTTASVNYDYRMFYNCDNIVGGNGTTYFVAYVDKTYARIDKAGQKGYFTEKIPAPDGDVNGDGEINVTDVTTLVSMILGSAEQTAEADVNSDGNVDVSDVTALVSIILNSSSD
ncbi:MAG: BspA family leucine-rich repeat surface protein [Bacteroidaceae bacterium]|nr:BspA family leucine-rich repeat surface protein [Bacteroidaceae bacterium]